MSIDYKKRGKELCMNICKEKQQESRYIADIQWFIDAAKSILARKRINGDSIKARKRM